MLRWGFGLYLALWIITGLFADASINRHFNEQFAFGYTTWSESGGLHPVVRVPYSHQMRKAPIARSDNAPLWRARSNGFAIAPFLLVDQAAWIDGPLSGFSGVRLVIWFFGYTHWFPLKAYWVA
jgi:hypothetical protein